MKLLIGMLVFTCGVALAQDERGDIRFVFYNVENLFDIFDDSLAGDEEFLPGGIRNWTWERFLAKERGIYKVLAAVGGWKPPEIIGLCEIENRFVLKWLVRRTPLLKYNYRIIHYDSPDERGMDVALLYLPGQFQPLDSKSVRIEHPDDPTRDILYVKGTVRYRDTLHVIICHWPSRWRGYLESIKDRIMAAETVRRLYDSITLANPGSRILLAGDLNDELNDPSISRILRIQNSGYIVSVPGLYDTGIVNNYQGNSGYWISDTCLYDTGIRSENISGRVLEPEGTLKYQGHWYEFDHIFVNGSFLRDTNLYVFPGSKIIFRPEFLLESDPAGTGKRPYRTYSGYRYLGGFSDHLPVCIDIWQRDVRK
jgi:hypothetical protein